MTGKEMISVRVKPELLTALRLLADERGESLSETLRRGALLVLGHCPTCHRRVEQEDGS